jgi:hypothetical protein
MAERQARCQWCDRKFAAPHAKGPLPKYCSASHRQAAFVQRRHLSVVEARLSAKALRFLALPDQSIVTPSRAESRRMLRLADRIDPDGS